MKGRLSLFLVALLILSASCWSQEIRLKQSLFSGWKYSANDGRDYTSVGISASSLRPYMEDNDEAIAQLDTYKSRKTTALILSICGGAMAGVAGGIAAQDDPDETTVIVLLVASVPFMIGAGAAEISATNHLLEAVRLHNNEQRGMGGLKPDKNFARSGGQCFGVRLAIHF